jgi:hypothetical protein
VLSSARDDLKRAKRDQKFEQNSPSTHAMPHPHNVSAGGGTGGQGQGGGGGGGGSGAASGAVGAAKGAGVGDVVDVHSSVRKVMKELTSQTCFDESGTCCCCCDRVLAYNCVRSSMWVWVWVLVWVCVV